MVERTAADLAGLQHVQVRVADARSPGLPPASYDVISSCLVLFFLPDPAASVRTWVEILAPGGRLGVTTFGPQDERWKQVDALFTPYLPQQMLDARTSGRSGPFGSDEGVAQLLEQAGLAEVRTAHRTVTAEFANPQQWVDFSWSHGQRATWECVPPDEHDEILRQAMQMLASWHPLAWTQDVRHTLGRKPAAE